MAQAVAQYLIIIIEESLFVRIFCVECRYVKVENNDASILGRIAFYSETSKFQACVLFIVCVFRFYYYPWLISPYCIVFVLYARTSPLTAPPRPF